MGSASSPRLATARFAFGMQTPASSLRRDSIIFRRHAMGQPGARSTTRTTESSRVARRLGDSWGGWSPTPSRDGRRCCPLRRLVRCRWRVDERVGHRLAKKIRERYQSVRPRSVLGCTINSVSEQDWAEISLSFVIALGHTKTARLGFGSLHSGYVSGREYSVHWSRSRLKGGCRQDCLPHSRLAFIAPDHCGC